MKKVAILNHYPVKLPFDGTGKILFNTAEVISSLNMYVEFFTFSQEDKKSKINNKYIQREYKSKRLIESGYSINRLVDLLVLSIMCKRPSYENININKKAMDSLKEYNPDYIIIIGHVLAKFVNNYVKTAEKKPKLMSIYDSYETIYNDYIALESKKLYGIEKIVIYLSKLILFKKYIEFHINYYKLQLDISDAIIVPTNKTKEKILFKFSYIKNKLFVIPPIFINYKDKSWKPKNNIYKILFIGNLPHGPNEESINIIKNSIAPKLPKFKFFIAGKGIKKNKINNIYFLGPVSNITKLLSEVDLCIAPILHGSGKKVKIFDYLSSHKAVIGTNKAFEGYPVKNNLNVIIENNIDKFPEKIIELNKNKIIFSKLQRNSIKVLRSYDIKRIRNLWQNVFNIVND